MFLLEVTVFAKQLFSEANSVPEEITVVKHMRKTGSWGIKCWRKSVLIRMVRHGKKKSILMRKQTGKRTKTIMFLKQPKCCFSKKQKQKPDLNYVMGLLSFPAEEAL